MATATFDRNIVLDQEATERLAEILREPAAPRPEYDSDWWQKNEREVDEWLSRYKS
jgi:hypothetical protein